MFLFLPLILGDAQFVSATYRLFKTPQDDQSEAGSVVTYKGNKICIIMTCCEKFIISFFWKIISGGETKIASAQNFTTVMTQLLLWK